MAEDYVPGSVQGTAVVRLFVRFAGIAPPPRGGDTVTINGTVYAVQEVAVDTQRRRNSEAEDHVDAYQIV